MVVPKQTHQRSKYFCLQGHNRSQAPNETSPGWRRGSQSKVKPRISFSLKIRLPAVTIPSGVTASGLETAYPVSLKTIFFSVFISIQTDRHGQAAFPSQSLPLALHQLQLPHCQAHPRYALPPVPSPPHFSGNKSEDIKVPACHSCVRGDRDNT